MLLGFGRVTNLEKRVKERDKPSQLEFGRGVDLEKREKERNKPIVA